jgi:hypothetical protein
MILVLIPRRSESHSRQMAGRRTELETGSVVRFDDGLYASADPKQATRTRSPAGRATRAGRAMLAPPQGAAIYRQALTMSPIVLALRPLWRSIAGIGSHKRDHSPVNRVDPVALESVKSDEKGDASCTLMSVRFSAKLSNVIGDRAAYVQSVRRNQEMRRAFDGQHRCAGNR